jgi:hypothetical protein
MTYSRNHCERLDVISLIETGSNDVGVYASIRTTQSRRLNE